MLAAALEDRFRATLGEVTTPERDEQVRFAAAFAQHVVRILPDDPAPEGVQAVAAAIAARTDLEPGEIDTLLRLALSPEHRTGIRPEELAAFGARFGAAAERAMRVAVRDELDLEGFAARYGPAEALLLLDSLFAVCAVDGAVDPAEIGRLQDAAARLQVDPMLVGLLFRKHDVRHARGDVSYRLTGRDELLIGRSAPAEVRLPDPAVGVRHAKLVRSPDGWRVVDLGSGRPTLLRGVPVASAPLAPGDEVRLGPYHLVLDAAAEHLVVFDATATSALSIRGLSRRLPDADRTVLLDGVSFTVFSGEVVALVGPSGAGKTVLLEAIAGTAPPDEGTIALDRADFHALLASDRSVVGIVPQEDVLHGELTVEETLAYAARLRLGPDAAPREVRGAVKRVITELGLDGVRTTRLGTTLARGVSGGQRKRVNLGQELLTRTTRVLFLDEPTSGLDPHTSQEIVLEIRRLADDGRVVFLVTHDVAPGVLDLVDHLLVLAPGGRIAWFGPPREALAHFGVRSVDAIFARLPTDAPEAWRDRYRASPAFRKYVRTREHVLGLASPPDATPAPPVTSRAWLAQLTTLTARSARVKARDVVGTGVLLAQAPLLALAFTLVFPRPDPGLMFVLVLSCLWFGASASVRELIEERPIWRREARVGVRLVPYVASKVAVLGALATVQCLTLVGLLYVGAGLGAYGVDGVALGGVAVATGLCGMALGLLLGAAFSSAEAAVGSLPLVLIPQIAFGGLLVTLKDMGAAARIVSGLTVTRYAFEAAIKTAETLSRPARKGIASSPEPVSGLLWELGFRTSDAADHGLPTSVLVGVILGFGAVFLTGATALAGRARRGV